MKIKNIIFALALALPMAAVTGCSTDEIGTVDELKLGRLLQPTNLNAKVNPSVGDIITFSWDVAKNAEEYNLAIYKDEEMTQEYSTQVVPSDNVPFSLKVEADQTYYFKVQATNKAIEPSKWAVYSKSIKTYAVKDPLYLKVADRAATSITVSWSTSVSDAADVTHITYGVTGAEETADITLDAAAIKDGKATISGLTPSKEYVITLYYLSASRGEVDAWTTPDITGTTEVTTVDALKNAVATAGAKILLKQEGSPYLLDVCDINGGVSIIGESTADGTKPVIKGEFHFSDAWANGGAVYFEDVELNGNASQYGFPVQKKNGGAVANIEIASIIFKNCTITGYAKGLIYEWGKTMTIGELTWDSCDINNINTDGTQGGDVIDFRGASTINALNLVNNTIYQGMRTFVRFDAATVGAVKIENNTLNNLCFVDNTNNAGIFGFQVVPASFSFKNNLFLNFVPNSALGSANAKYKTADDLAIAASNNWFFNVHDAFFTTSYPQAKTGFSALAADPCYNAKGAIFNISQDSEIAGKNVGAPKWMVPYVEEPEDLTLNTITAAHTWDLTNARYFSGDIKKSMVRDGLMIVASESNSISAADGVITFNNATVCTKKGLPSAGYLVFKVNKPGSVVVKPVNGGSSHVIVGVTPAEGGVITVKGGAATMAESNASQKILISDITEETLVYVYASGNIGISGLAWSEDISQVNTALPAPAPKVNPSSVTAGEDKALTVSWEAVPNAGSYSVVFSGKTYPVEGLEYTIESNVVKMLDAGSYQVAVYANPSASDIYNTQSEAGNGAFAILPAGGSAETGEFVVSTVEDFQNAVAAGKDYITLAYTDTPYAIGAMTVTAPMHLKGQTKDGKKTPITASFTLSGAIGGSVVFDNLEFVGDATSIIVEDKTSADTAPVVDTVAVLNSYLHGTKAIYDNSGKAVSDVQYIIIKGNLVEGCSDGADFIDLRTGAHHTIVIANNTFANSCRTFIRTDAVEETNYVTVRNNTFYKVATNSSSKDNNGIFHIRSTAGAGLVDFKVVSNLFYSILIDETPSNAAGFPKFLSKTGIAPNTIANNYFYNCEEREDKAAYSFWSYMAKEQAITGNGAILPSDPCKNAAAGDFTLTNGVAINANVGDPRWNPSRGSNPTAEITVTTADELLTAISAGKTTITLADGTYDLTTIEGNADITTGKLTIVKSLNLVGSKAAILKGGFIFGAGVENFSVKGITLDGADVVDNAFYVADGAALKTVSLTDCAISNYNNRLLYQDKETSSVASVVITKNVVTNMGTSGDFIDFRKGALTALKVMSNTFANGIRTFLRMDAAVVCASVQVTNNTFYNIGSVDSKDNNGIMHVRSTSAISANQVVVRNNIFAAMHRAAETPSNANGFPKLVSSTSSAIANPSFSHNYFYDVDGSTAGAYSFWNKTDSTLCVAGNGVILKSDPFKAAASGDFTLVSALAASERVGDPRWNTTASRYDGVAFEVATVEDFLAAVSAGKTDLLLTGTSYDFTTVEGNESVTSGVLAVGTGLTITGKLNHGVKPTVKAAFTVSATEGSFILNNLVLDGAATLSDMIVVAADANLSTLAVKNCSVTAYKNRMISGPNVSTVANVLVQGNMVTEMGTGGDFIDFRKGTANSIKAINNTFANGIRTFLRVDAAVVCGSVVVKNNTFYNIGSVDSKDNNGIMHVRSTTATADPRQIVVEKNIFAGMHRAEETPSNAAAGFPHLISKGSSTIALPTFIDNIFFDIETVAPYSWWQYPDGFEAAKAGTVLENTPFSADPATGKFTVTAAYKGYGDLRW